MGDDLAWGDDLFRDTGRGDHRRHPATACTATCRRYPAGRDGAQLLFGGFQNCLAKKSLLPSFDQAGLKCVRVGRAHHLNSSEIVHPLPDEL